MIQGCDDIWGLQGGGAGQVQPRGLLHGLYVNMMMNKMLFLKYYVSGDNEVHKGIFSKKVKDRQTNRQDKNNIPLIIWSWGTKEWNKRKDFSIISFINFKSRSENKKTWNENLLYKKHVTIWNIATNVASMFTRTSWLFSIVMMSSKYVGNFGHRPFMKFWVSFPQIFEFQQAKPIRKLTIQIGLMACWNRKI